MATMSRVAAGGRGEHRIVEGVDMRRERIDVVPAEAALRVDAAGSPGKRPGHATDVVGSERRGEDTAEGTLPVVVVDTRVVIPLLMSRRNSPP
jgi:hypothetical protein